MEQFDVDVIVVGAGLAGVTAASVMQAAGLSVQVLDKARGPGGRLSTRRAGDRHYDHGAQYFTARSPEFQDQLGRWREQGLAAAWEARIGVCDGATWQAGSNTTQRYVGTPGMGRLASTPARELNCVFGQRVVSLEAYGGGWRLHSESGDSRQARAGLINAPPAQSAALVAEVDAELSQQVARVAMAPCWALMLELDGRPFDWDAAFINEGSLSWVANNGSKPQRANPTSWVVHASPQWSREHLEVDADVVAEAMIGDLNRLPGVGRFQVIEQWAHCWRYALAEAPLEAKVMQGRHEHLLLAGDWCAGNRVEGAWLSGREAARRLINRLGET